MTTLMEALAPRSDQLNADDLIPGPRVLKFTDARIVRDGRDTKIVVNFEGDNGKPWKPCKTMGRAMVMAWGITDEKQLIGKSVRVFRDPDVKFGDQGAVGGIRISHMSHLEKPAVMKLTVSQGKKATYTFNPLVTEAPRQTAAEWAAAHIEAVRGAADVEALATIQNAGKKAVDKIAGTDADLHRQITDAYGEQLERFENPANGEKRADADMGEADFGEGM